MTQGVPFSVCLFAGIVHGGYSGIIGGLAGRSIPMIASKALGNFVGATGGIYLVFNSEVCKDFDKNTKLIVVLALCFFTSLVIYRGFSILGRTMDYNQFVKSQLISSLISYWCGQRLIQSK